MQRHLAVSFPVQFGNVTGSFNSLELYCTNFFAAFMNLTTILLMNQVAIEGSESFEAYYSIDAREDDNGQEPAKIGIS